MVSSLCLFPDCGLAPSPVLQSPNQREPQESQNRPEVSAQESAPSEHGLPPSPAGALGADRATALGWLSWVRRRLPVSSTCCSGLAG